MRSRIDASCGNEWGELTFIESRTDQSVSGKRDSSLSIRPRADPPVRNRHTTHGRVVLGSLYGDAALMQDGL
jgi:hypothetical protein